MGLTSTSTMHKGSHFIWDEDDRDIGGGEEEEKPTFFVRAMTDQKDRRPGTYSRKQQRATEMSPESWTCLDLDPDASLPSPLKPEIYIPERNIRSSKSFTIANETLPEYRRVRGSDPEVEYYSDLVREFDGSDEDSYEYMPDYKQPGAATEVRFEDVIPDYVTAEDEAVAYPLPFFTRPRSNSRPRRSRAEESRELYDEVRQHSRGRSKDISFGEGLPGQAMSYKAKRATVILPASRVIKKETSPCRDRGCNLVADPGANGFCLAHFNELQANFIPKSATPRTPSREIPRQKGYFESPRRTPSSMDVGTANASIKQDVQAQKRSYGTSPPQCPDSICKPQMKTQKTQTRNVSGQTTRIKKPSPVPTQNITTPNNQEEIDDAELERDYEDMVNNIIEVSKIATKKCRQPRCDNFGNEKCQGLCNGCYQKALARKAEKKKREAAFVENAQVKPEKVPADQRSSEQKTKPKSAPDHDIYRQQNREIHQCKVYGCRNYASKAGFCNACFNRRD